MIPKYSLVLFVKLFSRPIKIFRLIRQAIDFYVGEALDHPFQTLKQWGIWIHP